MPESHEDVALSRDDANGRAELCEQRQRQRSSQPKRGRLLVSRRRTLRLWHLARKGTFNWGARTCRELLKPVARAGTTISVVFAIAAVLVACGGSATSSTTTTAPSTSTTMPAPTTIISGSSTTMAQEGIEGTVTIGPIQPVSRPGEINSTPYVATFVIRALADNRIVATVTSAADGTFRVSLPAGEYVVESQQTSPYPFAKPQQVTVNPGGYTVIMVAYDSGIR